MKITKTAFGKAISKNLAPGKRLDSGVVKKVLEKTGVNLRHAGEIRTSQVKAAFEELKKEGMLKSSASSSGVSAFKSTVAKEVDIEAHPGLSEKQKLVHAKAMLHERMDEEAAAKKRVDEAFGAVRNGGQAKPGDAGRANAARVPVGGGAIAGAARHQSEPEKVMSSFGSSSVKKGETVAPAKKSDKPEEPPDIFGY